MRVVLTRMVGMVQKKLWEAGQSTMRITLTC